MSCTCQVCMHLHLRLAQNRWAPPAAPADMEDVEPKQRPESVLSAEHLSQPPCWRPFQRRCQVREQAKWRVDWLEVACATLVGLFTSTVETTRQHA